MKVVLLAFIDEFEAFLSYLQEKELNLSDFSIVALEPVLQIHLTKLGIEYKNTLPYFNNDSHKRIIVETEKVMKFIRKRFGFIDSNGIRNAYREEFAFYIRIYLNHLYKLIEIISNIFNANGNCEIYACFNKVTCANTWYITDNERLHGLIAMAFAKSKNARFINIDQKKTNGNLKNRKKISLGKRFKSLEKIFTRLIIRAVSDKKVILIPSRYHSFANLCQQIGKKINGVVFLSLDSTRGLLPLVGYNLLSFLRAYIFKKPYQRYIINTNFIYFAPQKRLGISSLSKTINDIVDSEFASLYTYRGINCLDFVKEKVKAGFLKGIAQMIQYSQNISFILKNLENKIVMSDSAADIMAIAGELGKVSGIPCLFISHGTHPVPIDVYHEMELYNLCKRFMLSDYSYVAISTPIQELHLNYFKQKYSDIENCEIKTGPLIFSSISDNNGDFYKKNLKIPEDAFVITHAVTVKKSYFERYYFLETLDEFFSGLSDVVDHVNKLDMCKLVIRIHPGFYLNEEEIRSLLPESRDYILHREGSFDDVLGATDLLISYSSTTIDEALINRTPVLLYDKWARYNHFNTTVYSESQTGDIFPVCYVNNRANLSGALNYMMEKIKTTKREEINVRPYSYDANCDDNLFAFIKDSLGYTKTNLKPKIHGC